MALTKQQAITEHRKMWNWIAEQLEKGNGDVYCLKTQYCSENELNLLHNCFCCEYSNNIEPYTFQTWQCNYCPLHWGTETTEDGFYCENGLDPDLYPDLYDSDIVVDRVGLWLLADAYAEEGNYEKAAEYARQIANLPERPNKEKDIL